MTTSPWTPDPKLDLVLERSVDVPPVLVWAAWTQPRHILHWFTPAPWKTIDCEIDLRPGGIFRTTMLSPEGQEFPNSGCFLEVVPEKRLVWTDALLPGYRPAENPYFTAVLTFTPQGKGTHYHVLARHRDEAGRQRHEEMGFANGWGT
ncbi:MAG: SRPBCC family protein, partial [Thermoanaerobaculia bacterium]